MRDQRSPLVTALCSHCGTPLAPAFAGRLRCPRMSACGYGGIVEDGRAVNVLRIERAISRLFGPPPGGSAVTA